MNYTKEQKDTIEKVISVFEDYITQCSTMDVVWSDKVGYILLTGISTKRDDICMHPTVLEDAETLCEQLLYEIACDVIQENGPFHDIHQSTPVVRKKIEDAFHPYLIQLPEYQYLADELFEVPDWAK